ncbi:uncharacterized protein K441DRAFT_191785 [Cenococcum geophilum 1.58]|uniref:uncharacterized protein n=1 Tax=Cenococcum geophilum 1.58 TaxID=794803 RepID=UPI00358EB0A3|nr:hypothetical protein K441DRAFT_191785 [Cenococcum geophilum 1.58]
MPPLSTTIIKDDDTSSFTISKLNSNQFTHSGDNNALSDSTLNTLPVTTPKYKDFINSKPILIQGTAL